MNVFQSSFDRPNIRYAVEYVDRQEVWWWCVWCCGGGDFWYCSPFFVFLMTDVFLIIVCPIACIDCMSTHHVYSSCLLVMSIRLIQLRSVSHVLCTPHPHHTHSTPTQPPQPCTSSSHTYAPPARPHPPIEHAALCMSTNAPLPTHLLRFSAQNTSLLQPTMQGLRMGHEVRY